MRTRIWFLSGITFLASFLLFQIQFIIGKIFLANFGGGFMVWGACLVFFQGMLLCGYLYAHKMIGRFTAARYLAPHILLLLLPLLFFPGRPLSMRYATLGLPMVADVFIHLALSIGPVFFVLSTMSIMTQAWLAASTLPQRDNPYALFAVSNAGSLLALISYPFVFEMAFDLTQQQNFWRVVYVAVVLLYIAGVRMVRTDPAEDLVKAEKFRAEGVRVWQWFLYGGAGVAAFLSVTNIVTAEVAPMPLLWMAPLIIYLFSYVLNFKADPWSPRWIEKSISVIIGLGVVLYFVTVRQVASAMAEIALMLVFVLLICMFCQRRLYVLRPDARGLTFFYFIVSLGGFFGGAVTTWVIPLVFVNYAEYFLGLVFLLAAWFLEQDSEDLIPGRVWPFVLIIALTAVIYWGPFFLRRGGWFGLAGVTGFVLGCFYLLRGNRTSVLSALMLFFILIDVLHPRWMQQQYVYGKRNYYGINRVVERPGIRMLLQGTTMHGTQLLDPAQSHIPLSYYHPESPPAKLLINERHYRNIGMIGLGTGSLAMYGLPSQNIDFYELDKDVVMIARNYFTFLRQAAARIRYIVADARIGLEQNAEARYEILIVDAFSGNSVPVHLLTLECLQLYRDRLTEDGVVLFHLANRYINLPLAFMRTAATTDAFILYKKDGRLGSDWIALTYDPAVKHRMVEDDGWSSIEKEQFHGYRPWTDGYSNIMPYFFRTEVFARIFEAWEVK